MVDKRLYHGLFLRLRFFNVKGGEKLVIKRAENNYSVKHFLLYGSIEKTNWATIKSIKKIQFGIKNK